MRIFMISFLAVLCGLPVASSDLKGMYGPAQMVEYFALIGMARLGVDETMAVQRIFGEGELKGGVTIPYEALFMMCNGTKDACANIHLWRDWYADKADVWCTINA